MSEISPPREVVDAFHLMWDNFPEPVSLVHKSREVIAVNKAHYFRPGVNCARTGRNGPHTHCLANRALAEKKTIAVAFFNPTEKKESIAYWMPLDGYEEYYVHFSVRFAVDYEKRNFALSPITDEVRENYAHIWDEE